MKSINNSSVVFLPGWGFNASVWGAATSSLKNNPVILLDLPEVNESEVVGSIARKLSEKIPDHSIIVAWSLSGLFAIQLCKMFPDKCSQLILISALPKFKSEENWLAISADFLQEFQVSLNNSADITHKKFLQLVQFPSKDIFVRKYLKDHSVDPIDKNTFLKLYLEFLVNADLRDELRELTIPITVIFGEKDAVIPVDSIRQLKEINPTISAKIIADASHALFLTHQEVFIDMLNEVIHHGA